MKRLILISLLMAMAILVKAQQHWIPQSGDYSEQMELTGVIVIDGQEQTVSTLELGVFCGDVCRGSSMLAYVEMFDRYLLYLTIYGESGDALSFRLYDHELGAERDLICSNTMTFVPNAVYGEPITPYVFDFVTEIVSHTITATVTPAEGGTVSGAGTFDHGSTCTLTATANEGYAFLYWTEAGEMVSDEISYTFMVTSDRTIVANFTNEVVYRTITVSVDPTVGGTVSGGGRYQLGESCTLTATANEGYVFTNWTENGELVSTNADYTFTVVNDRALVAHFEEMASDYHWYVNTYSYPSTLTVTAIIQIDGVEQPLSTLELGAFCGNECRGRERLMYDPLFNRHLLYLTIYGLDGDALSFKLYDHEAGAELDLLNFNIITFQTGVNYGLPTTPYVFNFLTTLSTHTITVMVNPAAGGTVSGGGTYDYGATCTLTATPSSGFAFTGWTEGDELLSLEFSYSFMVTEDRTIVANFTDDLQDFTITLLADPAAGGTLTGGGVCQQGSSCTVTATANVGYYFTKWTENGEQVSTDASYTFTVMGNRTLTANFEEITGDYHWFVNTYQFAGSMTLQAIIQIDGVEETAPYLEVGAFCGNECRGRDKPIFLPMFNRYLLMMTIYGENGHNFTFRLYDHSIGEELNLACTNTMTFELNANYGNPIAPYVFDFITIVYYDIEASASPSIGGTVTGAGTYEEGSTCTLTATANESYTFVNWTLDGVVVTTDSEYSFTVTEAESYVANFELSNYEITASANPPEGGTVTGAGTYFHGSTCTLTATANENYAFVNWTKGGAEVSTDETISFTVTEDADYVANFEQLSVTQTTQYTSGWNWYSTYIEQNGLNGLEQLEASLGNIGLMIKSQNEGFNSYLEGMGWYGTVTSITNEAMYMVKLSTPCEGTMTGIQAKASDHPITLSSGLTWIGYPLDFAMSLEDALAGFTPTSNDVLKSQGQGFSSYLEGFGWYGQLDTLSPGMGLMYRSYNTAPVTFTYPTSSAKGELKANLNIDNSYWKPDMTAYPYNMTVMAVVEMGCEELQGESYELAAFADGECRGSVRLQFVEPLNRYMAFLTVAGDEPTELHFGLYDAVTGIECFETANTLTYTTDANIGGFEQPFVVSFRGVSSTDELGKALQVYPNPVEQGQILSFGLMEEEMRDARVEIFNMFGVAIENNPSQSNAVIKAPDAAGIYTLRITLKGGETYSRKLVVK